MSDYNRNGSQYNNGGQYGGDRNGGQGFKPREIGPVDDYRAAAIVVDDFRADDTLSRELAPFAKKLSDMGYTVRFLQGSKAAAGISDQLKKAEPFFFFKKTELPIFGYTTPEAIELTGRYQPNWGGVEYTVRPIAAVNANLVLGKNLRSPAELVVLWSPDGITSSRQRTARTRYFGVAVTIAEWYGVPCFNVNNPESKAALIEYLKQRQSTLSTDPVVLSNEPEERNAFGTTVSAAQAEDTSESPFDDLF